MDTQLYMIPYPLQFFAFKSSSLGVPRNNGKYALDDMDNQNTYTLSIDQLKPSPEVNQTSIWNRFNIPLHIAEFHVVLMSDLNAYNFG